MLFGCIELTNERKTMNRFLFASIAMLGMVYMAHAQDAPKTVEVVFDNLHLPVFLSWERVGNPKEKGELPCDEKNPIAVAGKIPAGRIAVQLLPKYGQAWLSPAQYQIDAGKKTEYTVFRQILLLNAGEKLTVKCGTALAPWNSTIISLKSEPVLIGMARPGADFEVEKWKAGKGGKEEFSNSPLFLAKYGSKKIAEKLAKNYLATGEQRIDHWSIVPSVQLKDLTEEELSKAAQKGIEALMLKYNRAGTLTHEEDLELAKKYLKQISKK